jgi:hypothetical protein
LTELAELYALFAVIYLAECAAWVPRRTIGLLAPLRRWRARRTFTPNAGWTRGAVLGGPLPPLAPPLVAEPLPFLLGPQGFLGPDGFVPWGEVGRVVADGHRLWIDDQVVATLATRRGAAALAEALVGLGKRSAAERAARLGKLLDARFDAEVPRQRLDVFRREARLLRVMTNLLWATLFLGLPVLIWLPVPLMFVGLGVAVLLAWATAAVVFERTLRRSQGLPRPLWPDLTKRVVAVSSPLATVRSTDLLARELVGDLDPLAAAAPLLRPQDLGKLARPRLVDLLHREDPELPDEARAAAQWSRDQHLARVRKLLRAHDVDADALLAPPRRDRQDLVAWCPGCLAQYEAAAAREGQCLNDACRGIELVVF